VRATKVNAGLAESNGRLLLGIWRDSLHATCGLTACTPESAPGPTPGEYGKTLFFTMQFSVLRIPVPYQKPDINIINYLGIKFRFFACCAVAVPLYLPLL